MKDKIAHLRRSDAMLSAVIKRVKLKERGRHPRHFEALVTAIVNQQLSGKAAATILKRFISLFPGKRFPKPEDVALLPAAKMRKSGLSKMKIKFLKDLSRRIADKSLNLKKIQKLADEEVIASLTAVKGIGRWTAEMFLMFSLGREDVFSYGDLGLRNAMQKLYKLKKHPTPRQAQKISAAWKPYRTLACRYLWASLALK